MATNLCQSRGTAELHDGASELGYEQPREQPSGGDLLYSLPRDNARASIPAAAALGRIGGEEKSRW
jgi:hypothetical protein